MSQALRKLTGGLNQTNTTMIFINQLREKIGVFFGSPETTAGGKALKFYASVRLDIRRIETLKDGTEAVGNRTRVKVVKNKMAPPFKQAEFDILYGVGISREGSLIDYGVDHDIVKQVGRLVHLRRRPARAGQGERAQLPPAEPRHRRRHREEDPRQARHRAGGRGARDAVERRVHRGQARAQGRLSVAGTRPGRGVEMQRRVRAPRPGLVPADGHDRRHPSPSDALPADGLGPSEATDPDRGTDPTGAARAERRRARADRGRAIRCDASATRRASACAIRDRRR